MTDVIAERTADAAGASLYLLRHPEKFPHHLPSARYLAAESDGLAAFLDHVEVADCAACTPTTRSTGCAAAGLSWSYR